MGNLFRWVFGLLLKPVTGLAETYMKQKANVRIQEIEQEEARAAIQQGLQERILDDDLRRTAYIDRILRQDRGDWKTSWIRPVTAALALVFWLVLCLSQMRWGGNGLIPIIWDIPPGGLGQVFIAFPMGVLATFYIARPFEKFLIAQKGI